MRRLVCLIVLAAAPPAAATVPDGAPHPRPRPTRVTVRAADLEARGVTLHVAPGVGVVAPARRRAGKVAVTLTGRVEVAGLIDASALGFRVERDVDLLGASGRSVVGRARAGALVFAVRRVGDRTLVEAPAAIHGRFSVASDALGVAPREFVFPVPEGQLGVARGTVDLRGAPGGRAAARAALAAGARLDLLGRTQDGKWLHVRTYGGFAIEGWVPAEQVETGGQPEEAGRSRGITPTHEALVDTPAFADPGGKQRIGMLRGGALVAAGVEVSGPRVRVMTHGDVVGQLWVPQASLRALEASVWAEGL